MVRTDILPRVSLTSSLAEGKPSSGNRFIGIIHDVTSLNPNKMAREKRLSAVERKSAVAVKNPFKIPATIPGRISDGMRNAKRSSCMLFRAVMH